MWENFAIISELDNKPETHQRALFLHAIGGEALKIYNGFALEEGHKLDDIIAAFDKFAVGELNETYERFNFNTRQQQSDETFDEYLSALRNSEKTCNFGEIGKSLLRDRIVYGIQDKNTKKKLLQERKLTLEKTIDICRAFESSIKHVKSFVQEGNDEQSVHAIKSAPKQRGKECKYCGMSHVKGKCPAFGKICNGCGVKNHFFRVCNNKNKPGTHTRRTIHGVTMDSESDEDDDCDIWTSIN